MADEIKLEEVTRIAVGSPFWATRAYAIESYATLEQSLCMLFSRAAGVSDKTAGAIFFKISPQTRETVLSGIVLEKCEPPYRPFWESMLKEIRKITETRNKIVHWRTVQNIHGRDAKG